jgi:hypothetical protein
MSSPCPLIKTIIAEADLYIVGFIETVPRKRTEGSGLSSISWIF